MERSQRTEEKMGTKRSVLTDENGLPLSVVLSGANTPDVKLLEEILDHIRDFPSGTGGRPPTKSVFGRRLHGQWRKGAGTGLYASYNDLGPAARKRRSWSAIRISMHAAGSLRSHTLFSTAFANCSFVLRKSRQLFGPGSIGLRRYCLA